MRIAVGLLLLAPSLWLASQSTDLPFFGRYFDDGLYLSSAQGLAQGHGYRLMSLPETPPQVKYPPLVPALLATAWKASPSFPGVLTTASWLAWLPMPLFLWLSWEWLGLLPLARATRLAVVAAFAVNYHLLLASRLLMTDLWGLVFLLAAFIAHARGWPVIAGLAVAAGCLTRSACLPLVLVLPLFSRRRDAFRMVAAALPALAWWYGRKLWLGPAKADSFVYAYSEYGDHLQPGRLLDHLPGFISSAGWAFLDGGPDVWWTSFLTAVIFVGAVAGIVRGWPVAAIRPYAAYAGVYSLIVLCWRFDPQPRFLLPLLPLLAAGLAGEAERLGQMLVAAWRKGQRGGAVIVGGVFALLFGCVLFNGAHGLLVKLPADFATDRAARARLQPFLTWARQELPSQAKVAGSYDGWFYLETGRRGARIPDHLRLQSGRSRKQMLEAWARYALANGYTHFVATEADFGLASAPEELATVEAEARQVAEFTAVYRTPAAICYKLATASGSLARYSR